MKLTKIGKKIRRTQNEQEKEGKEKQKNTSQPWLVLQKIFRITYFVIIRHLLVFNQGVKTSQCAFNMTVTSIQLCQFTNMEYITWGS